MGMAAILVMWPEPFEQTFVPPSQGDSIWNLASIGPVVSEKKMFENVDNTHTHTYTYIQTTETYLYYKLTTEPKGSGKLKMRWTLWDRKCRFQVHTTSLLRPYQVLTASHVPTNFLPCMHASCPVHSYYILTTTIQIAPHAYYAFTTFSLSPSWSYKCYALRVLIHSACTQQDLGCLLFLLLLLTITNVAFASNRAWCSWSRISYRRSSRVKFKL